MVLDISPTKTRRRGIPVVVPEEPARLHLERPDPRRTTWIRIEADRYEVCRGDRLLGYVEVVGSVHVALAGERYDRAVEVAQSLLFELAIEALESAAGPAVTQPRTPPR